MNPHARTFATHNGYCHVLPDRIVLSREPVYGEEIAALVPWEGRPWYVPAAAGTLMLLVFTFLCLRSGNTGIGTMAAVIAVLLGRTVIRATFKTREVSIPKDAIFHVRYMKGQPPVTKAYFIVKYKGPRGGNRNKIIPLPAFSSRWQDARDSALEIFEDEGLLSQV